MKMLTHIQTDGQSYTNFKTNLAMMVIYLPVKFEFDWTSVLELESGNGNVNGQMDKKRTNEHTELHQL